MAYTGRVRAGLEREAVAKHAHIPKEQVMARKTGKTLRDAVVLITGGGRGIGRLYAHRLAHEGAKVALIARSSGELEDVAKAIRDEGGRVEIFPADVTKKAEVSAAITSIERQFGAIDVLINNAGVRGPIGNAWECNWDAWWETIEVNLGGAAVVSHAVIPKMAERRRGRVVNIVSEAGAFRWPTVSAYSVSKAALIKFTENLASECREFSLSVFAYHPGFLPIGLATEAVNLPASVSPAEANVAAWFRAQLESGKAASPHESAEQLVLLLSGAYDGLSGRYVTVHDNLDVVLERIGKAVASKDYRMLRASA
jgi:NAD(P)-dependent dehydrogenase (short-subunit alcohol dehydrogenase family)